MDSVTTAFTNAKIGLVRPSERLRPAKGQENNLTRSYFLPGEVETQSQGFISMMLSLREKLTPQSTLTDATVNFLLAAKDLIKQWMLEVYRLITKAVSETYDFFLTHANTVLQCVMSMFKFFKGKLGSFVSFVSHFFGDSVSGKITRALDYLRGKSDEEVVRKLDAQASVVQSQKQSGDDDDPDSWWVRYAAQCNTIFIGLVDVLSTFWAGFNNGLTSAVTSSTFTRIRNALGFIALCKQINLIENSKYAINYILAIFGVDPLFVDVALADLFNETCTELNNLANRADDLRNPPKTLTTKIYQARCKLTNLYDSHLAAAGAVGTIKVRYDHVMERTKAYAQGERAYSRIKPVVLVAHGGSGVGKTMATDYIARSLMPAVKAMLGHNVDAFDDLSAFKEHEKAANIMRVRATESQTYWEGYSNQTVLMLDELFSTTNTEIRADWANKLFALADSSVYPINMAFGGKGHTFFDSPFIIATGNFEDWPHIYNDKTAITRRIEFECEVRSVCGKGEVFDFNKHTRFYLTRNCIDILTGDLCPSPFLKRLTADNSRWVYAAFTPVQLRDLMAMIYIERITISQLDVAVDMKLPIFQYHGAGNIDLGAIFNVPIRESLLPLGEIVAKHKTSKRNDDDESQSNVPDSITTKCYVVLASLYFNAKRFMRDYIIPVRISRLNSLDLKASALRYAAECDPLELSYCRNLRIDPNYFKAVIKAKDVNARRQALVKFASFVTHDFKHVTFSQDDFERSKRIITLGDPSTFQIPCDASDLIEAVSPKGATGELPVARHDEPDPPKVPTVVDAPNSEQVFPPAVRSSELFPVRKQKRRQSADSFKPSKTKGKGKDRDYDDDGAGAYVPDPAPSNTNPLAQSDWVDPFPNLDFTYSDSDSVESEAQGLLDTRLSDDDWAAEPLHTGAANWCSMILGNKLRLPVYILNLREIEQYFNRNYTYSTSYKSKLYEVDKFPEMYAQMVLSMPVVAKRFLVSKHTRKDYFYLIKSFVFFLNMMNTARSIWKARDTRFIQDWKHPAKAFLDYYPSLPDLTKRNVRGRIRKIYQFNINTRGHIYNFSAAEDRKYQQRVRANAVRNNTQPAKPKRDIQPRSESKPVVTKSAQAHRERAADKKRTLIRRNARMASEAQVYNHYPIIPATEDYSNTKVHILSSFSVNSFLPTYVSAERYVNEIVNAGAHLGNALADNFGLPTENLHLSSKTAIWMLRYRNYKNIPRNVLYTVALCESHDIPYYKLFFTDTVFQTADVDKYRLGFVRLGGTNFDEFASRRGTDFSNLVLTGVAAIMTSLAVYTAFRAIVAVYDRYFGANDTLKSVEDLAVDDLNKALKPFGYKLMLVPESLEQVGFGSKDSSPAILPPQAKAKLNDNASVKHSGINNDLEVIQRNCFALLTHSGNLFANIIVFQGRFGVMNVHCFDALQALSTSTVVVCPYSNYTRSGAPTSRYNVRISDIKKIRNISVDRCIVMIDHSTFPLCANIVRRFIPRNKVDHIDGITGQGRGYDNAMIGFFNTKAQPYSKGDLEHCGKVYAHRNMSEEYDLNSVGDPIIVHDLICYSSAVAQGGVCGSPIYVKGKGSWHILGIHSSGSKNCDASGKFAAWGLEICREDLALPESLEFSDPTHIYNKISMQAADPVDDRVYKLSESQCFFNVAQCPPPTGSTNFVATNLLRDTEFHDIKKPAVLTKEAYDIAMTKEARYVGVFDRSLEYEDDIVQYGHHVDSWWVPRMPTSCRTLTLDEALFGYNTLPPVDPATSKGIRLRLLGLSKKEILKKGMDYYSFQGLINGYMASFEKGNFSFQVAFDKLKDETRDLQRVLAKKSRVFNVVDFVDNVLIKMALGDFIDQTSSNFVLGMTSCGIDPRSLMWERIYDMFKDKTVHFFDVDGFDHSHTLHIMAYFKPRIHAAYKTTFARQFAYWAIYSCIMCIRTCLRWGRVLGRGNSSGNLITTFLNTATNATYFLHVICVLCRENNEDPNIVLPLFLAKFYSDDNLTHLPRPWYTAANVVRVFTDNLRTLLTATDKSTPNEHNCSGLIEDCDFLSRGFFKKDNVVCAPLSIPSLLGQLCYVRIPKRERGNLDYFYGQIQQNLNSVAIELHEFPREDAYRIASVISRAIASSGMPLVFEYQDITLDPTWKLSRY